MYVTSRKVLVDT